MRIVIAAGIFPPDIGGPATYAEAFADYCHAHDIKVTVICFADHTGVDSSRGYAVHQVSRARSKFLSYFQYLFVLVRLARSADLIYAQGPVAGGIQALLASIFTRRSYLVKVTGDYAWEQGMGTNAMDVSVDRFQRAGASLPFRVRVLRSLQRLVATRARRVIVPSQYLRNMVRGWGVTRPRVTVIYNAVVEHSTPEMSVHEAKKLLGVSGCVAITIGRLVPWKGFETLIKLWPDIVQKVPDAHLYIIGSGPDHEKLSELINAKKLTHAVSLIGKKSQTELAVWYRASDLFVLNSGYEGLSHTIIEAMSYQVPCAVSDSGGNPELIQHEKSGLLFGYNQKYQIIEALTSLMLHPAKGQRYVEAASQWIQDNTHERMLDTTLELMQGLLYRDTHRKEL
jgi:glycosyltransferase involved in cell wall biosynthesis